MTDEDRTDAMMHASDFRVPTVRLRKLGLTVTPMTAGDTVAWITNARGKRLLLNHNLHSAYIFQRDRDFRDFYHRADRTVIDGMPILVLARRMVVCSIGPEYRIGSTDWIDELDKATVPGRLFVYGATPESNRDAVVTLNKRLGPAGWTVEGIDGYRRHSDIVARLRDLRPTLVIVGLGMPIQEKFLHEHWDELPDAVYATVGGAIDYVAGHNKLAPRWVGRYGVEWLWRLAHDPVRLTRRYLIEPFRLLWCVMRKSRLRSEQER